MKIELTPKFIEWYSKIKTPKPNLEGFLRLDLAFQIGIYLKYGEDNNLLLVANDKGYKIFDIKKTVDRLVIDHFTGTSQSIYKTYTLGIIELLKQVDIYTPF